MAKTDGAFGVTSKEDVKESKESKEEVKETKKDSKKSTISEISSRLDRAVADMKAKKEVLDKALGSVEEANAAYGLSVIEVRQIKTELEEELAKLVL